MRVIKSTCSDLLKVKIKSTYSDLLKMKMEHTLHCQNLGVALPFGNDVYSDLC